ncbi:M23 family metallopeptidase [bacterium]|nr:M23 family metallopeptidase [bacterium]
MSRLKLLAGFLAIALLFFTGSLIYYYAYSYKIFYYDDLQKKYDQLAADNKRIRLIERQYRLVKQENEKIRMVFGLLGNVQDSVSNGPGSTTVANEKNLDLYSYADDNLSKSQIKGMDQERAIPSDYLMYTKIIPSLMPVNSRFISQGFSKGNKMNDLFGNSSHLGYDIVAEEGAPVKAASDGWVVMADWLSDYGNTVILYHGFGFFSVYKHAQYLLCREGGFVKGGDIIATVGKTGQLATGTHLHFEIWKDGIPQDPAEYIPQFQDILKVSTVRH